MRRTNVSHEVLRITTTVLVTVVLLACATVVNAAEEKADDRWHFTITPYIWLPSISGSMKLDPPPGFGSGNVDIGPSNYLENLDFAGMLDLQAQKGRWSLLADIIYVDFSDNAKRRTFQGFFPGAAGGRQRLIRTFKPLSSSSPERTPFSGMNI